MGYTPHMAILVGENIITVVLPLSLSLSVRPSVCLSLSLSVKRSNSMRLPQKMAVHSSKTKKFCQNCSRIVSSQRQSDEILPGFLNFGTWQHQKWSNTVRLPSKMESRVPRTNAFCDFSIQSCHEKVRTGHTKCCTCHAKSPQQTWRSDAPKWNPCREISALTS